MAFGRIRYEDNVMAGSGRLQMRDQVKQPVVVKKALGDCGSTVLADLKYARDCEMIGASIWWSPEAQLQLG
ncbi:hypothetical protein TESG_08585 [Trichophyton tonsurans CBS 112818]|uniref:Uncharacterized protein n=2 Tax=Trichophyton TaxID=5550 RepID=F2PM83_TRIEC|nr:hypothetical protein TESG_08585 [Trichophyton tonsurans CBS 112818]EGE02980.1 hypothetical protein TEQG_02018 [Trichophyton equinum CBS 127.97]